MTSTNYLQEYIELRGLSIQGLADAIGLGYHCVQKTVKGHKRGVNTRAAITEYLGLDNDKTWGRGAVVYLRHKVALEAKRVADEKASQARVAFLAKYSGTIDNLTGKTKAVNV